jgi:Phage Mu protein F like protein
MRKNEKILAPLRPNIGIEFAFRRALVDAISQMHEDVLKEIKAAWNSNHRPGASFATLSSDQEIAITAYHGTPHEVTRFDLSKIGTGEGNEDYGFGLYFAENPAVARFYEEELKGHNIYTVELRLDGNRLLDWDRPLVAQPVGDIIRPLLEEYQPIGKVANENKRWHWKEWCDPDLTGAEAYHLLQTMFDARTLSRWLLRLGIQGVKYLDQKSRGAGLHTYNYVVFDDRLVKITHKNEIVMRDALAQDEPLHITAIVLLVQRLVRSWTMRFDNMAGELATYFSRSVHKRVDTALKNILKKGGVAAEWSMSPRVQSILEATIHENVSLIKSIPAQYLAKVEQSVMRSVQTGSDLKQLNDELIQNFGATKRRAALIARDQNNKATSAINRERQLEAGIKYAIWMHSGAGKESRPSHIKAGRDKVRFDVAKGWFDPHEKKWIQPGYLINCRCSSRPVVQGVV